MFVCVYKRKSLVKGLWFCIKCYESFNTIYEMFLLIMTPVTSHTWNKQKMKITHKKVNKLSYIESFQHFFGDYTKTSFSVQFRSILLLISLNLIWILLSTDAHSRFNHSAVLPFFVQLRVLTAYLLPFLNFHTKTYTVRTTTVEK